MNTDFAALRAVKDFPSLVLYLNNELGWEFESDETDDLTFEYEPIQIWLKSVGSRTAPCVTTASERRKWGRSDGKD